ncbi:hypothetical protein [Streptomyces sp. NPDC059063]|uniref:hypothetical protein n=1 Tax=unclassified Streptomyces TaxID=2593676 RepID=UPI0036B916A6
MEADLLRHYGVDLLDWHRGRLSSRRLAVLIRHLPRDSALHRELHGEAAQWSVTDYLLAHAVDQLAESNWMFAAVNRDEEADPLPHPEPIPRPDTPPSPPEPSEAPPSEAPPPEAPPPEGPDAARLALFFG